jgi:tRNA(Ile)-lysidine synthetase-like protein
MKTRYVVAVSGGVDSVVLLHQLMQRSGVYLVVAHFDHGIRDDSKDDAIFVRDLAKKYGLPFETKREELGKQASEQLARDRRYDFLRSVAQKYNGQLATAHHADDAVETVAINLTRGTGWRGLAVLDSDVVRPLIDMNKQEIIDYANAHNLSWHEDSTNASDAYLRNRLRQKSSGLSDDTKRQVLSLRTHQIDSKKQIDNEVQRLIGDGPLYDRYFFTHAETITAIECLRYCTKAQLTRPQLERALLAIKTSKPGTVFEAGNGVQFRFTSRNFAVELIK